MTEHETTTAGNPVEAALLGASPFARMARRPWRPWRPWAAATGGLPGPGALVALLCLAQLLLWGGAFALTYRAPEIDSAEQFVWAFSLENGYWKHPPLPSWILHALIAVFGTSVALPFVATQAAVVMALAITWRLGCEWMSPGRSLIAMALTSLVTYHNIGGDNFNHNTAMLPFQAAAALFFWRASRTGAWHLWALAGLAAGLSMLVKYVALFAIAGLLLYALLDRALHTRRQLAGLALATAVCCAVMVPHVLWLRDADFMPLRYARSVAQSLPDARHVLASFGSFAMIQALRLLPFAAGLAYAFSRWRDAAAPRVGQPSRAAQAPATQGRARLFACCAGLAPLLLPPLIGLLTQTELQSRWGANAFLLSGWGVLLFWRRADDARTLRRTLGFTAAAHLVLCLGMTLGKTVVAEHFHVRTRANFPGAPLAAEAQRVWRASTDAPLRLVASDIWLGGNIVAHNAQRVAVLIDGYQFKSPWVRDDAVAGCGALVLDDLTNDAAGHALPNPALDALMSRATATGVLTLPWANDRRASAGGTGGAADGRAANGRIRWGVIPPTPGHGCSLR